jgi:BioD-like phosphotransacetylase family protein
MSFLKAEFKMKSILVSSVEGYSGKSVVIIALGRILREKDDAKIRVIKELVELVLDLGRLGVK